MNGYEKLAGLMTKHAEVATFQRFDFLNTLNLLYLQAELVHLEIELKESMKDDLECRDDSTEDFAAPGNAENIENDSFVGSEDREIEVVTATQDIRDEIGADEKHQSTTETSSFMTSQSEPERRVRSGRDWFNLANPDSSSTWRIMLKTREKLKEYNEAVLRQKEMKSQDSPSTSDIDFLRRWFKDADLGDFPLIGKDSTLWETSKPHELIAMKARKGEDPLGSLFLNRAFLWWHNCIGHRLKRPLDEETRYFEYKDRNILRVADVFGSILSSALLVGSILGLYFVKSNLVRLGIVAAFTQVFSLVLVLITNARKVEVFAATAAFVAVQVVFIGTTPSPTP